MPAVAPVQAPSSSACVRRLLELHAFHAGRRRGVPRGLAKLEPVLARAAADLDDAVTPSDLALPGYRLHPLKGTLKGYWSISISGNWRLIFRFEEGDAYDVDLVDYH